MRRSSRKGPPSRELVESIASSADEAEYKEINSRWFIYFFERLSFQKGHWASGRKRRTPLRILRLYPLCIRQRTSRAKFPTVTLKVFIDLSSHFWHLCHNQYSKELLVQSSFKFFFPRSKIPRFHEEAFEKFKFCCFLGVVCYGCKGCSLLRRAKYLHCLATHQRCVVTFRLSKIRRNASEKISPEWQSPMRC